MDLFYFFIINIKLKTIFLLLFVRFFINLNAFKKQLFVLYIYYFVYYFFTQFFIIIQIEKVLRKYLVIKFFVFPSSRLKFEKFNDLLRIFKCKFLLLITIKNCIAKRFYIFFFIQYLKYNYINYLFLKILLTPKYI